MLGSLWIGYLAGDAVMNGATVQRTHRVTAVFQDAELSFDLARDATMAKLAEQLCILGERHGGPPLAVNVRVAVETARERPSLWSQ